ncbi:MAG: SUMF1/EgtB/PvdO family nonheme iron enzyme [gamma proteobacterium endosymbiont of Lamellibrachia anaximandri]|nr:SUMF1/EgtB/PvdO family nonheme iron enzyme [gamma proteobacterium endosymbiont of Lamellibrachia anaximandri]MBL3533480.1 SUMF1/EgtB/PvdO family nonheme iron enzyme [gamma proteobacterium endosymbiont of Lamellibrachia anaximandri]
MKKEVTSTIRIFVGSPCDVEEERKAAFEVIDRLNNHHWRPRNITVKGYGWDNTHYPKLTTNSPQTDIETSLPKMAEYDICIFILCHRLGTPLDESFDPLDDEGRQPTGTEYEFYGALAAETPPQTLIYRRNQDFSLKPGMTTKEKREAFEQLELVDAFIEKNTKDGNTFIGNYHQLKISDNFKLRVEQDLTELVNRLSNGTPQPDNPDPEQPASIPTSYLNWLRHKASDITLLGLDNKEAHNVRLPQVYVPAITPTPAAEGEEKKAPWEVDREGHDLLLTRLNQDSLYLPGAPGRGKTTFCNWVCWVVASSTIPADDHELATEYREELPQDLLGRLPILCRLREFWGHMTCQADNGDWTRAQLETALCDWLDKKKPDGLTSALFLEHLKQGNCLLIIDGFDEVPPSREKDGHIEYPRAALLSGLKKALPHWIETGNRILLTSRPYGLSPGERQGLGLAESELSALTGDLQRLFVQRWFHAADREKGTIKADGLLQQLDGRPDLNEFRTNPMLLTALCVKYDEGSRLPKDIHDLYSAVINQVLHNRYLDRAHEVAKVRRRLGVIAWEMHSGDLAGKQRSVPDAEIHEEEIEQVLIDYARSKPHDEGGEDEAADKREDLLSRSGLLLPTENNQAEFYHLSFQDFLAAERFVRSGQSVEELVASHAGTSQWRQTLLFLFARLTSREDLDTALERFSLLGDFLDRDSLRQNPRPAILLGDCLEIAQARGEIGEWGMLYRQACYTALEVVESPEHREALFRALGATGLDDRPGVGLDENGLPDIAWQDIPAGGVTLSGNAGSFPGEAFHLSRYPVTNAQFQAFIDDDKGYKNPEWWADLEVEPDKPLSSQWKEDNHPRERVSWYEAMAFCAWLSHRLGYPVSLPTEWQWQQAATSGNPGQDYPWGKKYKSGRANIDETSGGAGSHYLRRTTAVGIYLQGNSVQGVSDLAGNVWEWCLNEIDTPANTQASGTANRVLRGGSWVGGLDFARASFRNHSGPDHRDYDLGFRLSCSSPIMKD